MAAPRGLVGVLVLIGAGCLAGCSGPSAAAANMSPVQGNAASQSTSGAAGRGDATKLFADYKQQCNGKPTSERCDTLKSLVVAEISTSLDLLRRSRDQRNVPAALAAFDFPDEPDILISALRVLGQFPETPDLAEKLLPQLNNRSIGVQHVTAMLLSKMKDAGLADIGQLWITTHSTLLPAGVYDQYPDLPAHYAGIGFPKYAGAEWFSPADSDRSVGWSTTDDMTVVTRWFSQTLRADAMDAQQWFQNRAAETQRRFQPDPAKIARLQQVLERAGRGDQAAMAELDKLKAELDTENQRQSEIVKNGLDNIATPPQSLAGGARWIVAKEKNGVVAAVVVVYPVAALKRTVIQLAWDLSDFAAAWPTRQ